MVLAALIALIPAALIGKQVLDGVRNHFGEAYAVNFTKLKRQSILAPVSRELALSRRFANSVLTRQWLLDENNPAKQSAFFEEAEGYRQSFRDHNYFIASALSRNYYTNASDKPLSDQPRYVLSTARENDSWFFSSLKQSGDFNINVDYAKSIDVTRVWFNFLVRDSDRVIAIAGAGFDLSEFIKEFIETEEAGVTPLIINQAGAIQAHQDLSLIAFNQAGSTANQRQTLAEQLSSEQQREALSAAMQSAEGHPGEVSTLNVTLGGWKQLLALSYLPELTWHIVTAVDLQAAKVIDQSWLNMSIAIIAGGKVPFAGPVDEARGRIPPQVRLETRALDGDWRKALPANARQEGHFWYFSLPESGVEPLLRALIEGEAGIVTLSIERAGLHDAFVEIAGEAAAQAMNRPGEGDLR